MKKRFSDEQIVGILREAEAWGVGADGVQLEAEVLVDDGAGGEAAAGVREGERAAEAALGGA